jgi:hypothetical protein
MRRPVLTLILCCAASLLACSEKQPEAPVQKVATPVVPAGPVLRLQFLGLVNLASGTNTARLSALLNNPEAVATRKQVHDRLARTLPDVIFGPDGSRTNRSALLRPLLDELAASRFVFETHDERAVTWMLTVFLEAERRARWSTNLWQAADSTPVSLPAVNPGGTAWSTKTKSGHLLTVGVFDDCLMLSKTAPGAPFAGGKAGLQPAQSTNVIDLVADLPRLRDALGLPAAVAWPQLSVTVTAKGEALRSDATLKFANATPWQLTTFRLPTNSVRDPLISFTAAQGFGDWLARQPGFKEWEFKSTPNQLFAWARSDMPYNIHAAAPMPEASNTVVRAAPHALHTLGTNLQVAGLGRIVYTNSPPDIGWHGMPVLVPFVRPAPEPGDDFLLFGTMRGLVPKGPNTNPPPAELLNQFLPRTNLVYYDWEITEAKLAQWMPIFQLTAMMSATPSFPTAASANQWLRAVSPKLANTITEVTAVSPTELRAVRRSDLALTGIELALLARWLDNPAFPAFAYPTNSALRMPPTPGAK